MYPFNAGMDVSTLGKVLLLAPIYLAVPIVNDPMTAIMACTSFSFLIF